MGPFVFKKVAASFFSKFGMILGHNVVGVSGELRRKISIIKTFLIRAPCLRLDLFSKRKIRNHRRLHNSLATRCCQEEKMSCALVAATTPYGTNRFQVTRPGLLIVPDKQ